jgi:plastocyanin
VKWINADDTIHLITEKDGKFRSPALDTDDGFTQSFAEVGTVEYYCALHPKMTGRIVVEP